MRARGKPFLELSDTPPVAEASSLQLEKDLLIRLLQTLSESRNIGEYLRLLVEHVKEYSGCRCVGIRVLDIEGNIPYISYTGFSREFYDSECALSINTDKCMCINVIKGNFDSRLPFYTEGGSFISNGTSNLLLSISEEVIGPTRNVCNQFGYESVALIPMTHSSRILGLIHLADKSENKIPAEKIKFLERMGIYIGMTIHAFRERDRILAETIDERHKAEKLAEALKSEKATLDIVMQNTDAQLAYIDHNFNFILVNPAYATSSGHPIEDLIGKNHFELFPSEENKAIFEMVRDTGKPVEFHDKPFEFKDQPWRGVTYWDWTLTPVKDTSGYVQGLVLSLADTTDRKKLEQLKDDFIGFVSHELRSPLTVVIGAVNTALSEEERLSQEEKRQLLQDAALEAESLSHLVGNLLELSRAQADRLQLYAEPLHMDRIVQNVVERIRSQSSTHQFLIDVPKRLPKVHADQLRLERILYNLLENAMKYSPQGSKIRVSITRKRGFLIVGVTDQGIGISEEDQMKLFEPFQRLGRESILSEVKGVGLGLLVCLRLVEAHGGSIWVESNPGQGSSFFFTVPVSKKTS